MVTAPEAASLLAFASEFDNRGPSAEATRAWATVLAEFDFQECRKHIVAHYSREHRWIMPADIRKAIENEAATRDAVDLTPFLDALELPEWLSAMDDGPEFNTAWVAWRKEQARRMRAGEPLDTGEARELTVSEETVAEALESMRRSLVS